MFQDDKCGALYYIAIRSPKDTGRTASEMGRRISVHLMNRLLVSTSFAIKIQFTYSSVEVPQMHDTENVTNVYQGLEFRNPEYMRLKSPLHYHCLCKNQLSTFTKKAPTEDHVSKNQGL